MKTEVTPQDVHFVPDDHNPDDELPVEHKLPPYPRPFRDWVEGEPRYDGPADNYRLRIHYKLFRVWTLWAGLRTNHLLEELLSRKAPDQDCDEYVAKNCIVDILNEIAKILSDTELLTELRYLVLNEEEFAKWSAEEAKIKATRDHKAEA